MGGTEAKLDLCVIGASEAGLAACMGAVALGLTCALVDDGDASGSRNPDLALVTLAHRAAVPHRHVEAWSGLAQALARAAPDRCHARYGAMNVRLLRGTGRFLDPTTLRVEGIVIRARRFFIATGGHQPSWRLAEGLGPGVRLSLADLTTLREAPPALLVIGGGPDAVAAAQSLRRLGSRVTIVAETVLAGCDAELVAPLLVQLRRDGVVTVPARLTLVEARPEGVCATLSDGTRCTATHLLLAEEPCPALQRLDVDRGGLALSQGRLVLDRNLRTAVRSTFAIGRAAGARSTAEGLAQAGHALRAAFTPLPGRLHPDLIPVVTATCPEIAFVGRMPTQAGSRIWRHALAQTGGAAALGMVDGHIKIVTDARGRVMWAGLVGLGLRETMPLWALAIGRGLTLGDLAGAVAPIPSLSEGIRAVVVQDLGRRIASPLARRLLRAARWLS